MNPTTIRSRPWSENIKAMYNQIHFFKNFIAYVLFVRNKFSWISLVKYSTNLRIKRNTFLNFHLWEHHYWKKIYFLYLLIYWKYGIHEIRESTNIGKHEFKFFYGSKAVDILIWLQFKYKYDVICLFLCLSIQKGYQFIFHSTHVYFYYYWMNKLLDILFSTHDTFSVITFIRYTLKVVVCQKTKEPKQDRQILTKVI